MRESLLAAGAGDTDIDALAAYLARLVVECTDADSEERTSQFELLSHHLACTDVTVRISPDDQVITVQFPARPKTH